MFSSTYHCMRARRAEKSMADGTMSTRLMAVLLRGKRYVRILRGQLAETHQQVDHAVRVAPLVVVPGEHLREAAAGDLREAGVEDRRVAVADDVRRHERTLGELQD